MDHLVVDALVSDSTEDWILDMCIGDTVEPLFKWAKQYEGVQLQFIKELSNDTFYTTCKIYMQTDDPSIISHYILEHGNEPIRKLRWGISDVY